MPRALRKTGWEPDGCKFRSDVSDALRTLYYPRWRRKATTVGSRARAAGMARPPGGHPAAIRDMRPAWQMGSARSGRLFQAQASKPASGPGESFQASTSFRDMRVTPPQIDAAAVEAGCGALRAEHPEIP